MRRVMKTKVIIFDYDGTLTKVEKGYNSWLVVWEAIDKVDLDEYHYKKYASGEYTYDDWLYACLDEYRKYGVSRDLFYALAKKSIQIKGLEDTLKYLTSRGIKLYILSGGIKNIIDIHLGELTNYFTSIEAHEFIYDENGIVNGVIPVDHSLGSKDEYVRRVIRENNLSPEQLLFIGNGDNDETVYKTGARTLCLNPDNARYTDKKIWNNYIFTEDIHDILKTYYHLTSFWILFS